MAKAAEKWSDVATSLSPEYRKELIGELKAKLAELPPEKRKKILAQIRAMQHPKAMEGGMKADVEKGRVFVRPFVRNGKRVKGFYRIVGPGSPSLNMKNQRIPSGDKRVSARVDQGKRRVRQNMIAPTHEVSRRLAQAKSQPVVIDIRDGMTISRDLKTKRARMQRLLGKGPVIKREQHSTAWYRTHPNKKSTPKEIVGHHGHKPHGPSILWPALYEHLRAKGMTKGKAAAISNAAWKKHKMGLPTNTPTSARGIVKSEVWDTMNVDDDTIEKAGVRRVRTAAGAKRYGVPIGAPIPPGAGAKEAMNLDRLKRRVGPPPSGDRYNPKRVRQQLLDQGDARQKLGRPALNRLRSKGGRQERVQAVARNLRRREAPKTEPQAGGAYFYNKLLSAKDRKNHPRAQGAKLYRIYRRAEERAKWLDQLQREQGADLGQDFTQEIANAKQKMREALSAMEYVKRTFNITKASPDVGDVHMEQPLGKKKIKRPKRPDILGDDKGKADFTALGKSFKYAGLLREAQALVD